MLATGICCLLLDAPARSQEGQPEKARALLDQVKKSEQDRQITVKQTEIDRLKEDQDKTDRDSDGLKKTMESTSSLITDRSEYLSTLTADSKRLEHELAVAQARINAERLKIEGLRALAEAQGKSLSALGRRAEEAKARARVHTLEMDMLQAGKLVPSEGREDVAQTDLGKARRALSTAETKTEAEERLAHEAMKAANAKMTLAETKAATAQRLADNDPAPEPPATKPQAKIAEKSAEKPDSDSNVPRAIVVDPEKLAPIAVGPKVGAGASSKPAAKPAAKAAASTTSKAPKGTPGPAR